MKNISSFIWVLYFLVLNLVDCLATRNCVNIGLCEEVNPIAKSLMGTIGMNGALYVKMTMITVVCVYLMVNFEHKLARITTYIVSGLYSLLALWHLYIYIILSSRGLL